MVSYHYGRVQLTAGKSQDDTQVCRCQAHAQAERPTLVSLVFPTAADGRKDNIEKAAKKAAKEAAVEEKRAV